MVIYLNWFALYLWDESFQKELLIGERSWQTSKKRFCTATKNYVFEEDRKMRHVQNLSNTFGSKNGSVVKMY